MLRPLVKVSTTSRGASNTVGTTYYTSIVNSPVANVNRNVAKFFAVTYNVLMLDHAKVKALRIKHGLSQGDAAKLAGFKTRQQWSNLERDATGYAVSMSSLEKIAKALGVKAKDLLK